MKFPIVTVMIPTYNAPEYIERAIDSVLKQTYKNIDIIVSDDSTNDEIEKIINKNYINKVRYYRNIPSLGRVENYRYMLYSLSKGEFIINLDGDDFFINYDFIEKFINLALLKPEVILFFAKQKICNNIQKKQNNLKTIPRERIKFFDGNQLFLDVIFRNIEIPHLTTMYNKKKAIEIGFYKYNILSSDRESILKLLLNNKICFLNEYVGCWVHHGANSSQSKDLTEILENVKMYDRLYCFAKTKTDIKLYKLIIWKGLGKYKGIYAFFYINSKYILNIDKYKKIYQYNKILFIILLIDARLYLRLLKK